MKSVQKGIGTIHRAACEILSGAGLFQPPAATALGFADHAVHADEAWLQEAETPQAIFVTNTYPGATGKPGGTPGSAAVEHIRSAALNTWQSCH